MIADLQGEKAQQTAEAIAVKTGSRCMDMACDVKKKEDIGDEIALRAIVADEAWNTL